MILSNFPLKLYRNNSISDPKIPHYAHFEFRKSLPLKVTWIFEYGNMDICIWKHGYLHMETWIFAYGNMNMYKTSVQCMNAKKQRRIFHRWVDDAATDD
jgi:hypothetical protein